MNELLTETISSESKSEIDRDRDREGVGLREREKGIENRRKKKLPSI